MACVERVVVEGRDVRLGPERMMRLERSADIVQPDPGTIPASVPHRIWDPETHSSRKLYRKWTGHVNLRSSTKLHAFKASLTRASC